MSDKGNYEEEVRSCQQTRIAMLFVSRSNKVNTQKSEQNQQTTGQDTTQVNSDLPGGQGNLERYSNLGPHGEYLGPDPAG